MARRWTATDRGMAHLVRLVLADDWNPETAAEHLRALVAGDHVLRRMAHRVHSATADRPSPIADRAVRTLDRAIREKWSAGTEAGRP